MPRLWPRVDCEPRPRDRRLRATRDRLRCRSRRLLCSSSPCGRSHSAQAQAHGIRGDCWRRARRRRGRVLPGATITIRTEQRQSRRGHRRRMQQGFPRRLRQPGAYYVVEIALPNFATPLRRRSVSAPAQTRSARRHAPADAHRRCDRHRQAHLSKSRGAGRSAEGGLLGIADSASEGLVTGPPARRAAHHACRRNSRNRPRPGDQSTQRRGQSQSVPTFAASTSITAPTSRPPLRASRQHADARAWAGLFGRQLPDSGVGERSPVSEGLLFSRAGRLFDGRRPHIRYASVLERPFARISAGEDGWRRLLAAASPQARRWTSAACASKRAHNDGPWRRPDDYDKLNAVVSYSRGDVRNGLAVRAMAYRGDVERD